MISALVFLPQLYRSKGWTHLTDVQAPSLLNEHRVLGESGFGGRQASSADAPRPARGGDLATRHAAEERQDRELSSEGEGFLQIRRQVIIQLPLPNKRLKLAGGDRFNGSGVLCPG